MRRALTILVLIVAPGAVYAQDSGRSRIAPPTASATATSTTQLPYADTEILLKYQDSLRKETEATADHLNRLVEHTEKVIQLLGYSVGAIIILATGILAFLGIRSYRQVARLAADRLDARVAKSKLEFEKSQRDFEKNGRIAIDERLMALDHVYQRRQRKYLDLMGSFFLKLFETNADLAKRWLGPEFADNRFSGKAILWVDDDLVGIALFVAVLTSTGIRIKTKDATEEALKEPLKDYDLVISNLVRDPCDHEGVKLTVAIRKEAHTTIPIIIFTRPNHVAHYRAAIEGAGANAIATSERELFENIATWLSPRPERIIVNAVG